MTPALWRGPCHRQCPSGCSSTRSPWPPPPSTRATGHRGDTFPCNTPSTPSPCLSPAQRSSTSDGPPAWHSVMENFLKILENISNLSWNSLWRQHNYTFRIFDLFNVILTFCHKYCNDHVQPLPFVKLRFETFPSPFESARPSRFKNFSCASHIFWVCILFVLSSCTKLWPIEKRFNFGKENLVGPVKDLIKSFCIILSKS